MYSRVTIMGGEHRSRILHTPPGEEVTRPMTGRVKESIFNILRGWFEDAVVLDLFAGVGTMGLEALSRGARLAIFVERDRGVYDCMRKNIDMLGVGARSRALQADALAPALLAELKEVIDVVFVDPPYPIAEQSSGKRRILDQCARLRSAMGDRGWMVLRLPYVLEGDERTIVGFNGPEIRSFGDMHVHLYSPAAGAVPAQLDETTEEAT
ncbi:MAG: 16S rRNA (guanine(966)-N(2))-methyltransferase RsmD [Planctomycetota bacterium]